MATMPKTHTRMGQEMTRCLELCQQCHSVCAETLNSQRTDLDERLQRLLQDCVDICQTSANFMMRNSEFHGQTCGLCAEICLKCADACEEQTGDSRLAECARLCRQCAEACQLMAAMATPR